MKDVHRIAVFGEDGFEKLETFDTAVEARAYRDGYMAGAHEYAGHGAAVYILNEDEEEMSFEQTDIPRMLAAVRVDEYKRLLEQQKFLQSQEAKGDKLSVSVLEVVETAMDDLWETMTLDDRKAVDPEGSHADRS